MVSIVRVDKRQSGAGNPAPHSASGGATGAGFRGGGRRFARKECPQEWGHRRLERLRHWSGWGDRRRFLAEAVNGMALSAKLLGPLSIRGYPCSSWPRFWLFSFTA